MQKEAQRRVFVRREREETARPRCRRSMSLSFPLSLSLHQIDNALSLRRTSPSSLLSFSLSLTPSLSLSSAPFVACRFHPSRRSEKRRRKPLLTGVANSLCPLLHLDMFPSTPPIIGLVVDLDLEHESTADPLIRSP